MLKPGMMSITPALRKGEAGKFQIPSDTDRKIKEPITIIINVDPWNCFFLVAEGLVLIACLFLLPLLLYLVVPTHPCQTTIRIYLCIFLLKFFQHVYYFGVHIFKFRVVSYVLGFSGSCRISDLHCYILVENMIHTFLSPSSTVQEQKLLTC